MRTNKAYGLFNEQIIQKIFRFFLYVTNKIKSIYFKLCIFCSQNFFNLPQERRNPRSQKGTWL